jgi:hypothetical protein
MHADDNTPTISGMPIELQRVIVLPQLRRALSVAISATPLLHKELREEMAAEMEAEFATVNEAAGQLPDHLVATWPRGSAAALAGTREVLTREAVRLYRSGSVLGGGPVSTKETLLAEQAPYAKEAHNDYLAALVERGAIGLAGRPRTAGDPVERARKAVTMRIRTALKGIKEVCPELASHFQRSVTTGRLCAYAPEREVRWHLDAPDQGRRRAATR